MSVDFIAWAVIALASMAVFLIPSRSSPYPPRVRRGLVALAAANGVLALISGLGLVLVPIAILFNDTGTPLDVLFMHSILPTLAAPAGFALAAAAAVLAARRGRVWYLAAALVIAADTVALVLHNEFARAGFMLVRAFANRG
jgi:hypothetical protein